MTDPCEGGLAGINIWELWAVSATGALGEPAFPEEFIEESARMEMVAWGQFFEGAGDASALGRRAADLWAEIRVHELFGGLSVPFRDKLGLNKRQITPSKLDIRTT